MFYINKRLATFGTRYFSTLMISQKFRLFGQINGILCNFRNINCNTNTLQYVLLKRIVNIYLGDLPVQYLVTIMMSFVRRGAEWLACGFWICRSQVQIPMVPLFRR